MNQCILVALLPFAIIAAVLLLIGDAETEEASNDVLQKLRSNSSMKTSTFKQIDQHNVTSRHNSQSDNDCCRLLSCIPSEVVGLEGLSSRKSTTGFPSNHLCPLESTRGAHNTNIMTGGTNQVTLATNGSDTTIALDCNSLPPWSRLPRTQFTDHVLEIITQLDLSGVDSCDVQYHIHLEESPATRSLIPRVQCDSNQSQDTMWCDTLKRTFRRHPHLPHNVSIGFVLNDCFRPPKEAGENACLGSSSPGGKFTMPNMQELLEMNWVSKVMGYDGATINSDEYSFFLQMNTHEHQYRWPCHQDIPWEERTSLPIFRGTLWGSYAFEQRCHDIMYPEMLQHFPPRLRAVDFSVDHPDLLNARFSKVGNFGVCFDRNATNGLSKVLPLDQMAPSEYFSRHQVAVVLGGIGAAFRLTRHFMTGTAVVLQPVECKEWFTPYLESFVHYIPLSKNLDDLEEKMKWIQENPQEVKTIAENGRAFYDQYLTFTKNEQHIHELVYRLSEYKHFVATNQSIASNTKNIAP